MFSRICNGRLVRVIPSVQDPSREGEGRDPRRGRQEVVGGREKLELINPSGAGTTDV